MVERPKNIIPDLPLDLRATLAGGVGGSSLPQLTPTTPGYELAIRPQPAQPYSAYWSNFQPMADERRPVSMPGSTPSPAPIAPAAAIAPRGNGIVSNADVAGTYTPPVPKAGETSGSPIEIVRGLQRTNYLPMMDAQGRVSYQSEDFMREQAGRAAAAQKSAAETKKIESETAKNASVLPVAQFQEKAFQRFAQLQDVLERTKRDDPEYPFIEGEYKWLASVLQPKLPGAEFEAIQKAGIK